MQKNKAPESPSRCLWETSSHPEFGDTGKKTIDDDLTYEAVLKKFCSKPSSYQSLSSLCSSSLVVGQEFALTCLFLARHRATILIWQDYSPQQSTHALQQNMDRSQIVTMMALIVIAIYTNSSASAPPQQSRKAKVKQRSSDAILLAILLRMSAAVLRSLTASFSADTVEILTWAGMIVHWVSCDYNYANGGSEHSFYASKSNYPLVALSSQRPTFQGGTISLNAVFFSTTLLASRLSSNATVYLFVSSAIIIFAFYPAARHSISHHPYRACIHLGVTGMLYLSTCFLLRDIKECLLFASGLLTICCIAPLWRWWLQRYKRTISGPWDVVPASQMKLDY